MVDNMMMSHDMHVCMYVMVYGFSCNHKARLVRLPKGL